MDDAIVLALHEWASGNAAISRVVSLVGEYGIFLLPLGLIGLWILPASGVSFRRTVLFALVPSFVVAVLLAVTFHFLVSRPRPFEVLGFVPLFPHYADTSFASDHMLFGAALIGPAVWASLKLGGGLVAWLVIIGLCRIAAGVHYPTDVVGSILLAVIPTVVAVQLVGMLERATPGRSAPRGGSAADR